MHYINNNSIHPALNITDIKTYQIEYCSHLPTLYRCYHPGNVYIILHILKYGSSKLRQEV